MDAEKLSRRWFLAAVSYFVIGVALGVYMGASGDHGLYIVHAHINLVGWVSMALTGLLYRAFPAAASSRLATWHFWLYQIGAPVMLLAITALYLGNKAADPVAGVGSVIVLIAVLLFWWAIFSARHSKAAT